MGQSVQGWRKTSSLPVTGTGCDTGCGLQGTNRRSMISVILTWVDLGDLAWPDLAYML